MKNTLEVFQLLSYIFAGLNDLANHYLIGQAIFLQYSKWITIQVRCRLETHSLTWSVSGCFAFEFIVGGHKKNTLFGFCFCVVFKQTELLKYGKFKKPSLGIFPAYLLPTGFKTTTLPPCETTSRWLEAPFPRAALGTTESRCTGTPGCFGYASSFSVPKDFRFTSTFMLQNIPEKRHEPKAALSLSLEYLGPS